MQSLLRPGGTDIPLKDRILRASGGLSLPLVSLQNRPEKYKQWTDSRMEKACQAVQSGGLTVRRAAEQYFVPKSTLHDHVSGRVQAGANSGPPRYLTDEEEMELVEFLTGCASVSYARSRIQVIQLVQEVVSKKGLQVTVTHGWWDSFRRRHKCLSLRTAAPLAYARAIASDTEVIQRYYDLLERTLVDNELMDKPAQIFNLDETGMPLDPAPPLVIARRGQKHPSAICSGNKAQITVLSCCSAAGYALPPCVIFDRKSLKPELTVGEVPGTVYGLSQKGWIDGELFELWFVRHFLAFAPPVRPLLMLMDGHASHFQPYVVRTAAEEGVILFCLPPHTTHLTQPLDKGCFAPLKQHWREECWTYMTSHPDCVITRYQFSELFGKAWMRGMTMHNIVSGFHTTGVYPFDRYALQSSTTTDKSKRMSLAEKTGLKFIPLYSPLHKRPEVLSSAVPNEDICADLQTVFEDSSSEEVFEDSDGNDRTDCMFTDEENRLFQRRYEEGYDLLDPHYEKWIQANHPPAVTDHHPRQSSHDKPLKHSSVLSKLLSERVPVTKYPRPPSKASARVLTSAENLQQLERKEREKEKIKQEKERRKLERERKRLEKEKEKEEKEREKQR